MVLIRSCGELMPERLNSSRDGEVTSLRKAEFTYAEISRKMGLSRERIRHKWRLTLKRGKTQPVITPMPC